MCIRDRKNTSEALFNRNQILDSFEQAQNTGNKEDRRRLLGFRRMTSLPDFTDEMLELFFTYCSLNVVMMTIPVFMLCKRANFRSERIKKALANLTLCGFGVYMIHYFFTGPSVVLMRAIHVLSLIHI